MFVADPLAKGAGNGQAGLLAHGRRWQHDAECSRSDDVHFKCSGYGLLEFKRKLNSLYLNNCVACIPGERISSSQAEKYLEALDFDHDGVVDFSDILSWAAVMKQNHESQDLSLWTKVTKDVTRAAQHISWHQVYMVLVIGALARDALIRRGGHRTEAKTLRACGYLGLALYVLKMLFGSVGSETAIVTWAYKSFSALKERLRLK